MPEVEAAPVPYQTPALPETGNGWASMGTQLRIIDLKLLHPDASQGQIAVLAKVSRPTVSKTLSTEFAKQRLLVNYDIRPVITQGLKANALDAQVLHRATMRRGIRELKRSKPDSAVVHAAVKSATDTLKGAQVFKDGLQVEHKAGVAAEYEDITRLLADPEVARAIDQARARGNAPPPGSDGTGEAHPSGNSAEKVDSE